MTEDNLVPPVDVESTEETVVSPAQLRARMAIWSGVVLAILAVGLIVHLQVRVDPALVYSGDLVELPSQQSFLVVPLFSTGSEFFQTYLTRPGGLAEWAGAYLIQHFSTPYVGTAILSVLAVVVFVATNRIVATLSGCRARYMGLWPVLLLMVIWSRYLFHVGDCLAICVALLACAVYVRLARQVARVVAISVGTCVLYYAIGAPALLFAGMCGLVELIRRRLWWLGVLALAVGAVAPFVVGVWLLDSPLIEAYARMSGPYPHGLRSSRGLSNGVRVVAWMGVYGACLLAVVVAGLKGWWARRHEDQSPSSLMGSVCALTMVVATIAVVFFAFDTDSRTMLRIHRYAMNRQWLELLDETQKNPPSRYSFQSLREINRALAERRLLGSIMFSYPQNNLSLFAPQTMTYQSSTECRTYMELGMLNHGESLAAELLATWGPHPTLLRVLAEVFIVKSEFDAATVFLNRLSQDVVHGDWARQTLETLQTDPMLLDDPDINRYRSMIQRREVFDTTYSGMLFGLVREDPKKYSMAFEYLMGQCLLDRPADRAQQAAHLEGVARLMMDFVPVMEYQSLPEHYSELRVVHTVMTGQQFPLEPFRVPSQTRARFRRCYEVMQLYKNDRETMHEVLAEEMPYSYFRYFATGMSGASSAP
jgi:hypothetical protein